MRACALLFLAAVAGAGDLRPREGSGWAGFRAGTWIRVKRTAILPNKVPRVTIWTQTLKRVDERQLTLETVSKNPLNLEQRQTQRLPRSGEAAEGESEKVEKLKNEVVVAAGKRLDCTRRRITVTGPGGKRIITVWTAAEPQVMAKRDEAHYDAAGKLVYRTTQLLSSLDESREVGSRAIRCLRYRTRLSQGKDSVVTGTTLTSREVPGGLVWAEEETLRGAEKVLTMRVELLAYQAK